MSAQRKYTHQEGAKNAMTIGTSSPTIMVTHTFRYKINGAHSFNIQPDNLAVQYCYSPLNDYVRPITDRVRLNYIEMWSLATSTSPSRVTIEWLGSNGQFGPSVKKESTSYGTVTMAHLKSRPPKDSTAGFWHPYTDTSDIVTVSTSEACILDVSLSFPLYDGGVILNSTAALGATSGHIYYIRLDGAGGAVEPWAEGVLSI